MNNERLFSKLCDLVINFKLEEVQHTVKEALVKGLNPIDIIERGLARGAKIIGTRFEKGEAFLTELVLAGETMKAGVKVLKPELAKGKVGTEKPRESNLRHRKRGYSRYR